MDQPSARPSVYVKAQHDVLSPNGYGVGATYTLYGHCVDNWSDRVTCQPSGRKRNLVRRISDTSWTIVFGQLDKSLAIHIRRKENARPTTLCTCGQLDKSSQNRLGTKGPKSTGAKLDPARGRQPRSRGIRGGRGPSNDAVCHLKMAIPKRHPQNEPLSTI